MSDPEFARELLKAQRQSIQQNIRGLSSMAADAIHTMRKLMRSADDEVKFQAACQALERLFDADLVMRADESSNPPPVSGEN